jgi:hypothetical protein
MAELGNKKDPGPGLEDAMVFSHSSFQLTQECSAPLGTTIRRRLSERQLLYLMKFGMEESAEFGTI